MSADYVTEALKTLADDNHKKMVVIGALREHIYQGVKALLPQDVKYELFVTGSRAADTAYPTSDVDVAFVTDDIKVLHQIRDTFVEFMNGSDKKLFEGTELKMGTKFVTKTGLPWIPVDRMKFGDGKDSFTTKLDITFRTSEQHKIIQATMAVKVAAMSPASKLIYIQQLEFITTKRDQLREDFKKNPQDLSLKAAADAWEVQYMKIKTEAGIANMNVIKTA